MKILLTGSAGFVGFHTARHLLDKGYEVLGVDNLNHYYDVSLKNGRLDILSNFPKFRFIKLDLSDRDGVEKLFKNEPFDRVIHLAVQPGVRYSLSHPHEYIQSNISAFMNILEGCRHFGTEHLVYASSSSVYGLNSQYPLAERNNADHPVSLYGATKKANELMAHSYSHLYGLSTTGLRFFTVYGPWGRPDMAYFKFAKNIMDGKQIDVFNYGKMERDFTYIDDIVEGIVQVLLSPPSANSTWSGKEPDPSSSSAPYKIYNIGCNQPVNLLDFIREIEKNLGIEAKLNLMPLQPGDVLKTHADVNNLIEEIGYKPKVDFRVGVKNFIDWFLDYYPKAK